MNKYRYGVVRTLYGVIAGMVLTVRLLKKKIVKKEKDINRFQSYYNMCRCWVKIKQEDKKIANYLLERGYKEIAIYGMGDIGVLFCNELNGTEVKVKYGIDCSASERCADVMIVEPSKMMETVDAVIVSAIFAYDEIKEMLETMINCPILALDDLIYEIS